MKYVAFAGLRHDHIFSLVNEIRQNSEFAITGAWEENEEVRARHADKFPEGFYDSFEALLADDRVDIVAIGDYYGVRGQRAIAALKAGKHVMSDKPLCTKIEELDEIASLHKKTGLKVGCMLSLRQDAGLRLAEKYIKEGKLGKIHTVCFTGQHPLNYGKRPMWYFEEGKHGGVFNDIAIHGIDAVTMMTGLDYGKTIAARQWNAFAKEQPHFKDCAQLMGTLENGAGVIVDVSYSAPAPSGFGLPVYWRFSIAGENGFIEVKAGNGFIDMALAGDEQMTRVEAQPVEGGYFTAFLSEIENGEGDAETKNVLNSTRRVLEIQAFADRQCP